MGPVLRSDFVTCDKPGRMLRPLPGRDAGRDPVAPQCQSHVTVGTRTTADGNDRLAELYCGATSKMCNRSTAVESES